MEKKIKIIDLLNKIANGEEVPERFNYNGKYFAWDDEVGAYFYGKQSFVQNYLNSTSMLKREVEILDEEDEFEDIESFGVHYSWDYIDYKNIEELKKYVNKDFQNIFDTLDKLNKNQKKIIMRLKENE